GQTNSYVYRLKYARSETIAMAIMALYSNNPMALVMLSAMTQMSNQSAGGTNGGGYGGGFMQGQGALGSYGIGGMGMMGMMGMMGGGMMGGGMYPGGGYGYPGMGYTTPQPMTTQPATLNPAGQTNPADLTGMPLGYAGAGGQQLGPRVPHVIPNPFDNTLLIQATSQEYDQIVSLLRQLDVAPRQVLIDAKIYEVELTGAFAAGVSSFLE